MSYSTEYFRHSSDFVWFGFSTLCWIYVTWLIATRWQPFFLLCTALLLPKHGWLCKTVLEFKSLGQQNVKTSKDLQLTLPKKNPTHVISLNVANLRFLHHFSSQLTLWLLFQFCAACMSRDWSLPDGSLFLTLDVSCPKVITQGTTETKSFESTLCANPANNLQLVIPEEMQHMYIT